jgi:hypothetical protein
MQHQFKDPDSDNPARVLAWTAILCAAVGAGVVLVWMASLG